ncbi:hypothetical protein [Candidatus Formimonas warabiya]|uniref:Uncharacterized protein n=1 Tax=Formimonas warabiya TaxID=1761012 RepID=A0A3G1KWQ8_FORW1|nr:hypothetical protein [Candidatus Formimonas warabiya]ATW26871.1 hypothetical protein DCMF_20770 [Candidatus Formimonas warabiya]
MLKKLSLFVLLGVLSLAVFACAWIGDNTKPGDREEEIREDNPDRQENEPGHADQERTGKTSLGGISLGDSREKVQKVLGDRFTETINEEPGYYGEPQIICRYDSGINIMVGKDSQKVLDVSVDTPEFPLDSGVKVGDNGLEVLKKYRAQYDEFQGANSDGKITGWFKIEDESLLIFDFDGNNGALKPSVTDRSLVTTIRLAYSKHFD